MDLKKIVSLLLCLCVATTFVTARGRAPRLVPVSVDHCRPCSLLSPDGIDADSGIVSGSDSDSGSVNDDNTCQDSLRHARQSIASVIDTLSEFFHASRRHVMHAEAHLHGLEEPGSPESVASAFNLLTNASLHLKVAEELLGWNDLHYSDRLQDPLCSLQALLRWRGITSASLVCGRSTEVRMWSRTRSHATAMREMRKGLHKIQAVYAQLSNCSTFCDECGDL